MTFCDTFPAPPGPLLPQTPCSTCGALDTGACQRGEEEARG